MSARLRRHRRVCVVSPRVRGLPSDPRLLRRSRTARRFWCCLVSGTAGRTTRRSDRSRDQAAGEGMDLRVAPLPDPLGSRQLRAGAIHSRQPADRYGACVFAFVPAPGPSIPSSSGTRCRSRDVVYDRSRFRGVPRIAAENCVFSPGRDTDRLCSTWRRRHAPPAAPASGRDHGGQPRAAFIRKHDEEARLGPFAFGCDSFRSAARRLCSTCR